MLFAITTRKLKKAITLAREDGKIASRLSDEMMQTVIIHKTPALFWAPATAGDDARMAYIRVRSDATIYVTYASPCNPNIPREAFTPRAAMA